MMEIAVSNYFITYADTLKFLTPHMLAEDFLAAIKSHQPVFVQKSGPQLLSRQRGNSRWDAEAGPNSY
jgi:hypothetical protein